MFNVIKLHGQRTIIFTIKNLHSFKFYIRGLNFFCHLLSLQIVSAGTVKNVLSGNSREIYE